MASLKASLTIMVAWMVIVGGIAVFSPTAAAFVGAILALIIMIGIVEAVAPGLGLVMMLMLTGGSN